MPLHRARYGSLAASKLFFAVALALSIASIAGGFHSTSFAAEPRIFREDIEWCNLWIPQVNDASLPRVLLIGDSITQGYYDRVAALLKGKAHVARLTTSTSLGDPILMDQIGPVLRHYRFEIIHFNNGLHGAAYGDDAYREAFAELLALFKKHAPNARLIWAASTPIGDAADPRQLSKETDRIRRRNRIAAEFAEREKIPVNDLFRLTERRPEYLSGDRIHHTQEGRNAQAEQVAECLRKLLDAKK